MTVSEFLRHVRRIVVNFVVGRVLSGNGNAEAVSGLDDVTTYYLLHRHDFQMDDAPIGACILYAVSCGLSDSALVDQYDILTRTGGQAEVEDDDEEVAAEAADDAPEEGSGSKVKLKAWRQRTRKSLGYEAPGGRPVPLIDQIHRLMHLWKAGDVIKVDEYLETMALRRNALFHQLLQALIELTPTGSEERSLLESISNHVAARGMSPERRQLDLIGVTDTGGLS
jgi:putative DNA methylase